MPLNICTEEAGFGIYADTWFSLLKASQVHAIGAENWANDPNGKAQI